MYDSGPTKPVRVLHVVGALNRGGTETWLMNVLRRVDRSEYAMDFLVQQRSTSGYEDEARSLGAEVILCKRDVFWPFRFLHALRRHEPYDVVHSHRNDFNGAVLLLAGLTGTPVRVAHSHNDLRIMKARSKMARSLYRWTVKNYLRHSRAHRLATSPEAYESLFGSPVDEGGIIPCGIDLERTPSWERGQAVRQSLSIPDKSHVLGHVGGFRRQKNHAFLIDLLDELVSRGGDYHLILVGEGPLRSRVEAESEQRDLTSRVHFLGARDDVMDIMLGGMDIFVFPSFHEGLGLVLLEAQATGLPILASDRIPPNVDVVPGLVKWGKLEQGAPAWADSVEAMARTDQVGHQAFFPAAQILRSAFDIRVSVSRLTDFYRSILGLNQPKQHAPKMAERGWTGCHE